jgi:hypothetical protein
VTNLYHNSTGRGNNKFRYGLLVGKKIDILILGRSEIEDEFHYVMIMSKSICYITHKPILDPLYKSFEFLARKRLLYYNGLAFQYIYFERTYDVRYSRNTLNIANSSWH